MSRARQIAVIGAAQADQGAMATAQRVGRLLAEARAVVVCGGGGGVMEAASRGAREAGGVVLGIAEASSPEDAVEIALGAGR